MKEAAEAAAPRQVAVSVLGIWLRPRRRRLRVLLEASRQMGAERDADAATETDGARTAHSRG